MVRDNNFLKVKLNGRAPNIEEAGARILVTAGGVTRMREIMKCRQFSSAIPKKLNER